MGIAEIKFVVANQCRDARQCVSGSSTSISSYNAIIYRLIQILIGDIKLQIQLVFPLLGKGGDPALFRFVLPTISVNYAC